MLQVIELDRSSELPSEKVPVALSCWLTPSGRLGSDGAITIEVRKALLIETFMVVEIEPSIAVTVAFPGPAAVRSPVVLTETTLAFEVVYATLDVTSCELPSVKVAVASNC